MKHFKRLNSAIRLSYRRSKPFTSKRIVSLKCTPIIIDYFINTHDIKQSLQSTIELEIISCVLQVSYIYISYEKKNISI